MGQTWVTMAALTEHQSPVLLSYRLPILRAALQARFWVLLNVCKCAAYSFVSDDLHY